MRLLKLRRLPEADNPTKQLFLTALDRFSIAEIADRIGLHQNSVRRWVDMDHVPADYHGDLARMLGHKQLPKGVDQFYTKPVVVGKCWGIFERVCKDLGIALSSYHFIEPSAGCGWFYNQMPQCRRTGIDIEPNMKDVQGNELIEADFLTWLPPEKKKYAVVGNPPFGLRGHLALQFINHAAGFADVVAFILPQLFESDGKGVPAKRVKGLVLAHSEKLPADSFETPDGKPLSISTIFQVWTRVNTHRVKLRPRLTCKDYIKVYSLSNGGTPSSTRNKKMLYKCDVYLPSTCFSQMKACKEFEKLPLRRGYGVVIHKEKKEIKKLLLGHNWTETAFRSTNSALNLRRSMIEDVVTRGGFCDEE